MAQLAILGHATRGKEVIKLLEMLGGKNDNHCCGGFINRIYFINGNGYIESCDKMDHLSYFQLSLEEFLEKLPYKVGDKVKCWINGYCSINNIKDIQWDSITNEIKYKIQDYWYSTMNLQSYKEEAMEEKLTIQDIRDNNAEWLLNKLQEMSAESALQTISDLYDELHKPQYPKTYEECCELLKAPKIHFEGLGLYEVDRIKPFIQLLRCRDAYWQIADWKFNYDEKCYYLCPELGEIQKYEGVCDCNAALAFPTKEVRDMFLENFRELINQCKELL